MKSGLRIARGALVLAPIAAAALLAGGARNETVASRSARAFAEAQRRGESLVGQGHEHGGHAAHPPAPSASPTAPSHNATALEVSHPAPRAAPSSVAESQRTVVATPSPTPHLHDTPH